MSQDDGPFASPGGSTSLPFPLYCRGKVRDVYDIGGQAPDRGHRSTFGLRCGAADAGSRQGRASDRDIEFLVRSDKPIGAKPSNQRTGRLARHLDGSSRGHCRTIDRGQVGRAHRHRVRGSGTSRRIRMEGVSAARERSPAKPFPPDSGEVTPLPERRFTPAMKNDIGHDENISRERLAAIVGTDVADRLEATSLLLFDRARRTSPGKPDS